MDSDKLEAIRNVVDRVTSYQGGAEEGTVEKKLRRGLGEAGIDLQDQDVGATASAVEDNPGKVTVSDVIA